ncbi:MAG: hypothetical protein IOD15_07230 [Phycisphaerales bacterium]|jgi:hypothetical protein|nr:hypothetical protein [Phycisphaerales bacterium]
MREVGRQGVMVMAAVLGAIGPGAVAVGQGAAAAAGAGGQRYDAKSGQTLTDTSPFSGLTLEEGLAESIRRTRYLVVAIPTDEYPVPSHNPLWKSRMLRAWLAWHAVVVEVPASDRRRLAALDQASGGMVKFKDPLVFVNGKWVRTFGSDFKNPIFGDKESQYARTGVALALKMDLTDEATRATNPTWHANHTRLNPPPEPVRLEPLHQTGDDDGPPAPPVAAGDDAMQVLERARAAARERRDPEAISLYTLLWEQAHIGDPAMAAVRMITVAPEVAALVERSRAARRRFETIRTHLASRRDWFGPREFDDWLTLSGVVGDRSEDIPMLAEMLGMSELRESDDETATSRPRRLGFAAVTWRPEVNAVRPLAVGEALDRIAKVAERLALLRAAGRGGRELAEQAGDREMAEGTLRWVVVSEACRQHVRALEAGDEALAERAVAVALGVDDSVLTRQMLVAAAVAGTPVTEEAAVGGAAGGAAMGVTGQGRPLVRAMHARLLGEAEAKGAVHVHLRERVAVALAEAGGGGSAEK